MTPSYYLNRIRENEIAAALDAQLLRLVLHKPSRNTQNRALLRKITIPQPQEDPFRLPLSFTPSDKDVIIGTGSLARNHVGNQNLINIVKKYSEEYCKLTQKSGKGMIITKIIKEATKQSPTGTPFVKSQNGRWYAVEQEMVRERVSQSMRNVLHSKYKSSTTAKKRKRVQNYQHYDSVVREIMQKRGNIITERMRPLYSHTNNDNSSKTDEEICELFTQANLDILESLKSLPKNEKK